MIIAITGGKEEGKSTAAATLEKRGFIRISFASPLKYIVHQVFNIGYEVMADPVAKEMMQISVDISDETINAMLDVATIFRPVTPEQRRNALKDAPRVRLTTPRKLMQYVGTELFRNCVDTNYWLDCFRANLLPDQNYVCDDCRFPNEAELIHLLGGKIIRIKRVGIKRNDGHASENVDDLPLDYKIINYDLNQYKKDVNIIVDLIMRGETSGTQFKR